MRLHKLSLFAIATTMLLVTGCAKSGDDASDANITVTTGAEPSNSEVSGDTTEDGNPEETTGGNTENNAEVSYPITITHALGETVIENKPERVATISWSNQDTVLALGVVPVGVSTANFGEVNEDGLLPWTAAAFKELGVEDPAVFSDTDGLDFEAISDANPDVILAAYSGITQEEYDTLSMIAPVVAYPEYAWQTYWRDQTIMNATGMGMKAEGEALVAQTEALIAEKLSAYPELEGKSAAFFYFNESDLSSFYVYFPTDPRGEYLNDLGLVFPESVMALSDGTSFTVEISAENIDLVKDIDIIVAYGDDATVKALQADSLIGQIPAVANGAIAMVGHNSALAASCNPTVLSIPSTIDEYLKVLAGAAAKVSNE